MGALAWVSSFGVEGSAFEDLGLTLGVGALRGLKLVRPEALGLAKRLLTAFASWLVA